MATTTTQAPVQPGYDHANDAFIFNDSYREKPARDRNTVAKTVSAVIILLLLWLNGDLKMSNKTCQTIMGIIVLQGIFELVSLIETEHISIITGFVITAAVLIWYMAGTKSLGNSTSVNFIIFAYLMYLLVEMNIKFKNSNYPCEDGKTDRNIYAYTTVLSAINALALVTFILKNDDMESIVSKKATPVLSIIMLMLVNIMTMINIGYMRDVQCDKDGKKTTKDVYYQSDGARLGVVKALVYNALPIIVLIMALLGGKVDFALLNGGYFIVTSAIVLGISFNCPKTICEKDDPDADNKVNVMMEKFKYFVIFASLMLAAANLVDYSGDNNFSLTALYAFVGLLMLLSSFNWEDEALRVGLPVGLVALTVTFIVIAKSNK